MHSRRGKNMPQIIFIIFLCVCIVYGGFVHYQLRNTLEEARARATQYQQQQESLTAQLQVVYEHRSRLEKILQKEKSDHKRTKEDNEVELGRIKDLTDLISSCGDTPVKENPFLVRPCSYKAAVTPVIKGSKEISKRIIEEPDWLKTNGSQKSKRVRTIFTQEQLDSLEQEFARQQYMVGSERLYLASTLHLTESQVKVWFQNRRIKWRKQNFEKQQAKLAKIRALQKLRESDGETSICSEAEADDRDHQEE